MYDFRELDWQIAKAKHRKKKLLLTLGMKAPRWPEYFIPDWVLRNIRVPRGYEILSNRYVRENALKFIKEVVTKYQNEDVIYAWQVENEPFDKSGPNDWRISEKFLRREMALVKELDTKKRLIVVNTLVNSNKFLRFLSAVYYRKKPVIRTIDVADIPALNVYEVIGNKIGPFKRCYRSNTEELKQYLLQFVKKTKSKKKSYGLLNYKQSYGNRGIWFIKAKSF